MSHLKNIVCPKCGQTGNIWYYSVEYRTNEVRGVSTKSGFLDYEDIDFAPDKTVAAALSKLGLTMPVGFLTHEPEAGSLSEVCHVWLHDRSTYISRESKLSKELQERLNMSEKSADDLVSKFARGDADTVFDIINRASTLQTQEERRKRLAAKVGALLPIEEPRALELVDRYLTREGAQFDGYPELVDAEGIDVIKWAIERRLT